MYRFVHLQYRNSPGLFYLRGGVSVSFFQIHMIRSRGDRITVVSTVAMPRIPAKIIRNLMRRVM
jgi:hypothetical protein